MSSFTYSASNETNLMKQKYGKLIEKQFNKSNVILGRIKKMMDYGGKGIDRPVIQSIGGGVGNGSLPTANENKIGLAKLNDSKKMYAVASVDRETMKRAQKDSDSFVRMTKFPIKIATEAFNRNLTRQILKNDIAGVGKLLTWETTGATATSAGKVYFDVTDLNDASVFEAIEIGDILDQYASGDTSTATGLEVIDVVAVESATGYLATGSYIEFSTSPTVTDGDYFVMQNSVNAELDGIAGVVSATSGTYKNISIGRRWQSYRKNASAAVSSDLMNDCVLKLKKQCGESPDVILASYHQYVKILNFLEDAKRYALPARAKSLKGQVSFAGVEFMSADGPIPVIPDRFMDNDKLYFLNTNHIELHLTPGGFEWFDEDGTVFLRDAADTYSARFGGYGELFVNPHFQAELHSLTR
jgi:hypothetical protein